MTALGRIVRVLRTVTDPVAPLSFNHAGYELNRLGFEEGPRRSGAGRVALVTGASSGIGRATALDLARRGFEVWLLCRDRERGERARGEISRAAESDVVRLAVVDLSLLSSVRRFAEELPRDRVDVLVHNAGALAGHLETTPEGNEVTFATSVLGPFALTTWLADRLFRSDDARVVFVSSGGLYLQKLDVGLFAPDPRTFDGARAYANAKRAQVVLARTFAERLDARRPVTFASMHPGWADTRALEQSLPRFHRWMRALLRTPEESADTVVWLATADRPKATRGLFWFDRRAVSPYALPFQVESDDEQKALWKLCVDRCAAGMSERREVSSGSPGA